MSKLKYFYAEHELIVPSQLEKVPLEIVAVDKSEFVVFSHSIQYT